MEQRQSLQYMVLGKLDWHMQKIRLDHQLTAYTTKNSKWIKRLKCKSFYHKTIKLLEENIGSKISDIQCNNIFADISPKALETKQKNKQMGLHQIKKLLYS